MGMGMRERKLGKKCLKSLLAGDDKMLRNIPVESSAGSQLVCALCSENTSEGPSSCEYDMPGSPSPSEHCESSSARCCV